MTTRFNRRVVTTAVLLALGGAGAAQALSLPSWLGGEKKTEAPTVVAAATPLRAPQGVDTAAGAAPNFRAIVQKQGPAVVGVTVAGLRNAGVFRHQRKDGSTFPAELGVSEIRLDSARMFVGVVRDISDRKRAEQKLRENAELLTAYYERSESEQQLAMKLVQKQLHRPGLKDPRRPIGVRSRIGSKGMGADRPGARPSGERVATPGSRSARSTRPPIARAEVGRRYVTTSVSPRLWESIRARSTNRSTLRPLTAVIRSNVRRPARQAGLEGLATPITGAGKWCPTPIAP